MLASTILSINLNYKLLLLYFHFMLLSTSTPSIAYKTYEELVKYVLFKRKLPSSTYKY